MNGWRRFIHEYEVVGLVSKVGLVEILHVLDFTVKYCSERNLLSKTLFERNFRDLQILSFFSCSILCMAEDSQHCDIGNSFGMIKK